jgi:branched-chain amino acid aminotransferase
MIVFLNGKFVDESQAMISVFDRGFLYGDGLFEGFRVFNGKLFRWEEHLRRFHRGLNVLQISSPFLDQAIRGFAEELVLRNQMPDALLRLVLTRGAGVRGYSPKGANKATMAMTMHPAPRVERGKPEGWKLIISSYKVPANDPLAQFKNCNKLPQIMARSEADAAGAEEALLLNSSGNIAEGTTSNVFWVRDGSVQTPPLPAGILPGVTRSAVIELCRKQGMPVEEVDAALDDIRNSDGVFLSLTSFGIVEILSIDGQSVKRWPALGNLHSHYCDLLTAESV